MRREEDKFELQTGEYTSGRYKVQSGHTARLKTKFSK